MIGTENGFGTYFTDKVCRSVYGNMTGRLMRIGDREAACIGGPTRKRLGRQADGLEMTQTVSEQRREYKLAIELVPSTVWHASVFQILKEEGKRNSEIVGTEQSSWTTRMSIAY